MSSVLVVDEGETITFDPADVANVAFDHRSQLHAGIQAASVVFTITAIRQGGVTALTKDSEARLTAADATIALEETISTDYVVTQLRLIATTATEGDEYAVASKIVTTENPTQTKERSIRVVIQNR
jgi:hypothetical protein